MELVVELSSVKATLFVGFRGESASLYFGQDAAFHFNDRGELRRAYLHDRLLKAEHGRLVAMRRERSATEVSLVSQVLGEAEEQSLLTDLERRLAELAAALAANAFRIVGQIPAKGNAVERLRQWLAARVGAIVVASAPNVGRE